MRGEIRGAKRALGIAWRSLRRLSVQHFAGENVTYYRRIALGSPIGSPWVAWRLTAIAGDEWIAHAANIRLGEIRVPAPE